MTTNTLITGWNGFFGSILCSNLDANGTNIVRCGRVEGSDIKADLALSPPVIDGDIQRVIHSAGVTPGPTRPINTSNLFTIGNVQGTSNLLTGLSSNKPESFVLISSASVYGKISGNLIEESAPLLATSEYAKSKRDSELLVAEWCDKHNIALTIVRLPLVVGVGAPGTLGQLINAIRKRRFVIPGDGSARKSMVLATDVADWLVNNPSIEGTFNLTDQQDPSYAEICDAITHQLQIKKVPRVPASMMKAASWLGDSGGAILKKPLPYNTLVHTQLTQSLTFSCEAAKAQGWNPNSVLENIDSWLN
ncbi:SDR family oxidoreductase [Granulosicoccus sp.]|nr:SDR family oxidoreductase [Granulosicoccus sp.]MDB4222410.1 SDR family oxidoreductase [Granulosicoccus sp.]